MQVVLLCLSLSIILKLAVMPVCYMSFLSVRIFRHRSNTFRFISFILTCVCGRQKYSFLEQ